MTVTKTSRSTTAENCRPGFKLASSDTDVVVHVSQYMKCENCIHQSVCKWLEKWNDEYPESIVIPVQYPFIQVQFVCSEFLEKPQPDESDCKAESGCASEIATE